MQKLSIAAFLFSLAWASLATAGPYTDDLSKCLVKSTSPDDQVVFMQWMFSAMALHPAVSSLASISAEQHVTFDKKAASLFVRLMSADCRQQTIDAVKFEGATAVQTSFQLFGQVAMRGLMSNAQVADGLKTLGTYFQHDENWISVLREAGNLSAPTSKQ
jgi:hypothetical protein